MSEQSRLDTLNDSKISGKADAFGSIKTGSDPLPTSGYTSAGSVHVTSDCNTNTVNGTKGYAKMPC